LQNIACVARNPARYRLHLKGRKEAMKVENIPLKLLEQNENSRVIYKTTNIDELMRSMRKDGQLQPIGVRKIAGGKYDVVFGNRRILAAQKLGWDTIAANILEGIEKDQERDLLNLIENLKRQNTTVAEDGRMYCVLRDYGLSVPEISARLDVPLERVQTSIDVWTNLPKEYHTVIVNRTSGKKIPGKISATAAAMIMNTRRKNKLTQPQTRKLLDFAKKEETTTAQVNKLGSLMAQGLTLNQAVKTSTGLTRITLTVFIPEHIVRRLEKKYPASINKQLTAQLLKNKEFQIFQG
jgi:ParB/RepB/Spo0J family partition protein